MTEEEFVKNYYKELKKTIDRLDSNLFDSVSILQTRLEILKEMRDLFENYTIYFYEE